MRTSMVRQAALAYTQGQYSEATKIYQELAKIIGMHCFKTNILMCKNKLKQKRDLHKLKRDVSYQLELMKFIVDKKVSTKKAIPNRICYIVHSSLPYSSVGYATRTHGMAQGLKSIGLDIFTYTRPGFPLDVPAILPKDFVPPLADEIDGIYYNRILHPQRNELSVYDYVLTVADIWETKFRDLQPECVLAASDYITALPALIAARRLGIVFIYEVRGLWEITRMSREAGYKDSPHFTARVMMETAVCQNADYVFTLTEPMRQELVKRGADQSKIGLLPNCCDPDRFLPHPKDEKLAAQLGIPLSLPVIGYVGTFVDYEGLEDLVSACAMLKRRGRAFRLLLVGNEKGFGQERGPVTSRIIEVAESNDFADWLILTGRVLHEDVERYYSLIDIVPFPRKPWPVCEMVSPLKPLEALAMGKAVVVSDVQALQELIIEGETGISFKKGSIESLANNLEILLNNSTMRLAFGQAGRRWVQAERTWRKLAEKVADTIRVLLVRQADRR